MEQLSVFFKALADPTRLRIMNLLLRSPFCVCEMERILKLLEQSRRAGLRPDNPRAIKASASDAPGVLLERRRCICP
jgi:DNA-binding transcriptional ArsR family regulator